MAEEFAALSADVAERFRRGDEDCLPELLRALSAAIERGLKAKYGGALRPDTSEDVLFLALARAWDHRKQYDPEKAPLGAWLWAVADHLAGDLIRTRRVETPLAPEVIDRMVDRHPREAIGAVAAGLDPHLAKLVHDALARLPSSQRFVLTADANSPGRIADAAELARELGVSTSVIRQLRCRGLQAIEMDLRQCGVEKHLPACHAPAYICMYGGHDRQTGNGERGTGNRS